MKRKLIATLVATMMFGSCLNVSAAGLKDIFNAKYYADQYPDLYDAFGDNWDLYVNHFFEYGINEDRVNGTYTDYYEDGSYAVSSM